MNIGLPAQQNLHDESSLSRDVQLVESVPFVLQFEKVFKNRYLQVCLYELKACCFAVVVYLHSIYLSLLVAGIFILLFLFGLLLLLLFHYFMRFFFFARSP